MRVISYEGVLDALRTAACFLDPSSEVPCSKEQALAKVKAQIRALEASDVPQAETLPRGMETFGIPVCPKCLSAPCHCKKTEMRVGWAGCKDCYSSPCICNPRRA